MFLLISLWTWKKKALYISFYHILIFCVICNDKWQLSLWPFSFYVLLVAGMPIPQQEYLLYRCRKVDEKENSVRPENLTKGGHIALRLRKGHSSLSVSWSQHTDQFLSWTGLSWNTHFPTSRSLPQFTEMVFIVLQKEVRQFCEDWIWTS